MTSMDKFRALYIDIQRKLEDPDFWVFLFKLTFPFAAAAIFIAFVYAFLDWEKIYPVMAAYFFPPLGKESVIPAGIAAGLHPAVAAASVAFVEAVVGLFIVWNFDLSKKIPLVGRYIRMLEERGEKILYRRPWIRKFAFTGLIFVVMIPFQGSGAVSASIIGRIIGMKPRNVWIAILTGGLIGSFMIAYFADTIFQIFIIDRFAGIILIAAFATVVFYFYRRYWQQSL